MVLNQGEGIARASIGRGGRKGEGGRRGGGRNEGRDGEREDASGSEDVHWVSALSHISELGQVYFDTHVTQMNAFVTL